MIEKYLEYEASIWSKYKVDSKGGYYFWKCPFYFDKSVTSL